jgi:hypothetical protein
VNEASAPLPPLPVVADAVLPFVVDGPEPVLAVFVALVLDAVCDDVGPEALVAASPESLVSPQPNNQK